MRDLAEIQTAEYLSPEEIEQKLMTLQSVEEKAIYMFRLGVIESLKKNYDKAIKVLESAQKLFSEFHDFAMIANCLAELALTHYRKSSSRLIRSHTLLNDAKYLVESQKTPENIEIEGKILHYYGIISYNERHFPEALKYYKNARSLLNEDSIEYAKITDNLGLFYLRSSNYSIAIRYLNEALEVKKKIDNKYELSNTYLLLGRYHASVENYEKALKHLKKAAEITFKFKDFMTSARAYDELAKVYFILEDYQKALIYCEKSIKLAAQSESKDICAFSFCTKANILVKMDQPSEALNIIQKESEPVFQENHSKRGNALLKQVKARIFNAMGKNEIAIENLHEAIELYQEIELQLEVAKCYYELSLVYKDTQNSAMIVSSLLEALRVSKNNDLPLLTQKIEDFLYEIDLNEWSNVIEKEAKKEKLFNENSNLLETLNLMGSITTENADHQDPLFALLRLGRSIAAETNIDSLLQVIMEETKNALSADRCTVFLLDKDTDELWSKVALGMGSQEIRFPAHMGLAGHVAMSGETINIKDAYNDSRFNKEIDKKTGYHTKTILCMPIRNMNHEIVGVFQVLNKQADRFFNDKDEDLLIAIGSSAGIALENARLFQKQQQMLEEQKRSLVSFINTLAASIDARDSITAGHSHRVTQYTSVIADQLGITGEEIEVLEYAAALHDIGKIGIKDSVLCKEGKLTDEEYKHIQEHAKITNDILDKMYFAKKFKDVPIIASSHHEKYNGKGYFRGAEGTEIPKGGRIIAVSDVFDAITSKRHYRDRMPIVNVLNILKKDAGSHFDPDIIDVFFNISVDKILDILINAYDTELRDEQREFFSRFTIKKLHEALLTEELKDSELKKLIERFNNFYNGVFDW